MFPSFESKGNPLCSETDPEVFFPEGGESPRQAKQVCSMCDYKVECLAYALKNPDLSGVWGGTTPSERQRMRRLGKVNRSTISF
jgi:WhiB family transcriptional regulator, redox-sensing transcriptional regulator